MMRRNIRIGALALTAVVLVATQEALPAPKGGVLGNQSQTGVTAVTTSSGKKVKMSHGEQGVISRLNGWFNNPRPTDPAWQQKVQAQIAVLQTEFNDTATAATFQNRYNALTGVSTTATPVVTTTAAPVAGTTTTSSE